MTNISSTVIEIEGLCKQFGDYHAVKDLSLSVVSGEILALLGPNGAGKTTTINCLLGFLKPDAGSIRIAGFDPVTQTRQCRAQLAYIPEQVALYPKLSGFENLSYLTQISGVSYCNEQLRRLLVEVNLPLQSIDKPLSTYSKGMRQKVGIAIALAKKAKALILDEPTSGLDPYASYEFSQLLQQLANNGVAVLMATHDLFRAQEDAHSVAILNQGKLVHQVSYVNVKEVGLESIYLDHIRAASQC